MGILWFILRSTTDPPILRPKITQTFKGANETMSDLIRKPPLLSIQYVHNSVSNFLLNLTLP